jgi:hypothetical protein
MFGMSMVMPTVEEIILEIVPQDDVLRLRVGQKTIAITELEDRALVKLSELARRYARRRKMRFVDVTRNWRCRDRLLIAGIFSRKVLQ